MTTVHSQGSQVYNSPIEMMLAGAEPPDGWEAVLRGDGK